LATAPARSLAEDRSPQREAGAGLANRPERCRRSGGTAHRRPAARRASQGGGMWQAAVSGGVGHRIDPVVCAPLPGHRSRDRIGRDSADKKHSIQIRVIGFELVPPCGWHFDKYFFELRSGEIRRIEIAETVFEDLDFERNVDIKIDAEFSSDQKILFLRIEDSEDQEFLIFICAHVAHFYKILRALERMLSTIVFLCIFFASIGLRFYIVEKERQQPVEQEKQDRCFFSKW
jgi:hypothetical protein